MTVSSTSVIKLVQTYCQEAHSSASEAEISKVISMALKTLSPLEKWNFTQKIDHAFHQKGADPAKIALLKKTFCTFRPHWKESLVEIQLQVELEGSYPFFKYCNNLKTPLDPELRTRFFSNRHFSAVMGSTFSTNKKHRISKQEHPILDAFFAGSCPGSQGEGYVLALGDGAGGHFGDLSQDERIAKASHSATKTCGRLLSLYEKPEDLLPQIPATIQSIAKEISQKTLGEGSTLVGCRAFRLPKETGSGFRIVGFNIGDCMLVGWHLATHTAYPLLSAHVSEAGTAFLPTAYRSFEIHTVDTVVPEGTLLFLLSDGIHDHLPFQEQEGSYPNGLKYRTRSLTGLDGYLGGLPTTSPPSAYLQAVVDTCFKAAENERQRHQKTDEIQMGDDVSILQCYLPLLKD